MKGVYQIPAAGFLTSPSRDSGRKTLGRNAIGGRSFSGADKPFRGIRHREMEKLSHLRIGASANRKTEQTGRPEYEKSAIPVIEDSTDREIEGSKIRGHRGDS